MKVTDHVSVEMPSRLAGFKYITLISVLLLALQLSYNTLLAPPINKLPDTKIWLIQVLPLLLMVPGLLRGGHRSFALLCFLCMMYFMAAVINAFTPGYTWPPYVEIALIVIMFVSAMLYARYVRRDNVA